MSLEPGQILAKKYRIVRKIGEGGMGEVFEGENTFIRRRVAIKVLHAAACSDPAVLTRFEREAQAAGRIGSDHILEVLDLGEMESGDRFMVMEFLDGEPLADRIRRSGTLTPRQAMPLARQALVGLGAAHAAGIVHRDLKPDNIFVLREKAGHADFVKIIDFGISKFNALNGDLSMTSTGAVMGTPYYMAPEQARGAASVDARTDIYAMGVILHEALTGSVPFDGVSFNDLMFKIVLSDPPPLPDSVEPGFIAIVRRAMARDQADRFQTTQEFIEALDAWSHGAPAGDFVVPAASKTLPNGSAAAPARPVTAVGGASPVRSTVAAAPLPEVVTPAAARTGGNWAATQADVPVVKQPLSSKTALLISGTAVLLAAGALFVLRGNKDDADAAKAESAAALAPVVAEAKPLALPEPATPPAQAAAVAPTAPVEPAPAAAVVPAAAPVVPAAAPAPAAPAPAAPAAAAPAAPTKSNAVKTVKTTAPAPVAEPAPAPVVKPAKKPSAPDFGY